MPTADSDHAAEPGRRNAIQQFQLTAKLIETQNKLEDALAELRASQESLRGQNIDLVRKTLELSELRNALEDANREMKRQKEIVERRVEERTGDLIERTRELERMNRAMVGRELRMIELKEEIARLRRLLVRVRGGGDRSIVPVADKL